MYQTVCLGIIAFTYSVVCQVNEESVETCSHRNAILYGTQNDADKERRVDLLRLQRQSDGDDRRQ